MLQYFVGWHFTVTYIMVSLSVCCRCIHHCLLDSCSYNGSHCTVVLQVGGSLCAKMRSKYQVCGCSARHDGKARQEATGDCLVKRWAQLAVRLVPPSLRWKKEKYERQKDESDYQMCDNRSREDNEKQSGRSWGNQKCQTVHTDSAVMGVAVKDRQCRQDYLPLLWLIQE